MTRGWIASRIEEQATRWGGTVRPVKNVPDPSLLMEAGFTNGGTVTAVPYGYVNYGPPLPPITPMLIDDKTKREWWELGKLLVRE